MKVLLGIVPFVEDLDEMRVHALGIFEQFTVDSEEMLLSSVQ